MKYVNRKEKNIIIIFVFEGLVYMFFPNIILNNKYNDEQAENMIKNKINKQNRLFFRKDDEIKTISMILLMKGGAPKLATIINIMTNRIIIFVLLTI